MIQLTEAHIADFFNKACTAIGQNQEKIKSLFTDASFNFIQSKEGSVLEITTEYFSLLCLIGNENRCEGVYVFINKEEESEPLMRILRYCRRIYRYNYLLKMWLYKDNGIDLRIMDQSILLVITKMETLPDDLRKFLDSEFLIQPCS